MSTQLEKISILTFSFLKPIYTFENKKRIHIGTSTLFSINQENFLVTAAHVLEERKRAQLFLQDLPLNGGFWTTNLNSADFALYQISPVEMKSLRNCTFLSENLIDDSLIEPGMPCQLLGYPASKNKNFSNASSAISPEIHQVNTRVASPNKTDGQHHFRIEYSKKIFSPKGMSGGLVVSFVTNNVPSLKILGMPTEHENNLSTIKCISYRTIVSSFKFKTAGAV
jgi:hypothetical protein